MVVQTARDAAKVRFDERGLVPCVMQDARSGEVLTLAYMNEESLLRTLETREIHLYSRSRRETWHKGASSGNYQRLRQIRYDCDGDALVALVDPAGPACHTGQRSCFYREVLGSASIRKDAPLNPTANKILTAYGLMEFSDMSRVHEVDQRLIDRTQNWLVSQQQPDGSFKPDTYFINEGATTRYNTDVARITAYIGWALAATGYKVDLRRLGFVLEPFGPQSFTSM